MTDEEVKLVLRGAIGAALRDYVTKLFTVRISGVVASQGNKAGAQETRKTFMRSFNTATAEYIMACQEIDAATKVATIDKADSAGTS